MEKKIAQAREERKEEIENIAYSLKVLERDVEFDGDSQWHMIEFLRRGDYLIHRGTSHCQITNLAGVRKFLNQFKEINQL